MNSAAQPVDVSEKTNGDTDEKVSEFAKKQISELYDLNKKIDLGLPNSVLYHAEDLIPEETEDEGILYSLVFRTGDPEQTQNLSWRISGFAMDTSAFKLHCGGNLISLYEKEESRSICWVPVDFHANMNKSVSEVRNDFPPELLVSGGAITAAKYLDEVPNFIVPGYKVKNPRCNGHGNIWDRVITVSFSKRNGRNGKIKLGKRDVNFSSPDYAVPVIDKNLDTIEIHCF